MSAFYVVTSIYVMLPAGLFTSEAGLRGASIDVCLDERAFDLTRPAGFAFFGPTSN